MIRSLDPKSPSPQPSPLSTGKRGKIGPSTLTTWRAALLALLALLAPPGSARAAEVATLAGTGASGFSGDGGPASAAQLNNPYGLCRGPGGALYVCDMGNHRVRRIDRDGVITTVAGSGRAGYAGDGGPATAAELNEPYEVRFSPAGDMYFVEMKNHVVRKVDGKTGTISTFAGTGNAGFSGDGGPATRAQFNQPHAIQFDAQGKSLYVCDIGNNRVRQVLVATGEIRTFAGDGTRRPTPDSDRFSASVPLNGPRAIDFTPARAWVALREGNALYSVNLIARVELIDRVAGTGRLGFTGNGGRAKEATLSGPKGISVGPDGNVYLADTESHSVRMVDVKKETMELVAGTGQKGDGPDGDPLKCRFNRPHGIFVDADGTILVGDSENHRVRAIRRGR
jgi:DNA-binding beta-propeller fold protein YncE